jgi:hypothetical protein
LRCDGKSVNCSIKGMKETTVEGLDAFWNEFGILAGFVGSGRSEKDGFEEEYQSKDGRWRIFEGGTEGGITAGSEFQDAKEREVTILDGTFGLGRQLAIEGVTEGWGTDLALWRGEPL